MKIRKGSVSYWILHSLENAADNSFLLDSFSYSAQMRAFKGLPARTNDKTLSQALRRMKLSGVIEYEKDKQGKIIMRLSDFGKELLDEKKKFVWDGKYRIIIWDIPESKRRVRNILRRRLKDWGFTKWQNSVWVSKRNVTTQLRKLIDDLEIAKWVAVIESEDNTIRGVFK